MGWELSSSTALDYLDHVLPRLYLPLAVDMKKLRRMTESIICYASLDYYFTYKPASLLAASAILFSLQECVRRGQFSAREKEAAEKIIREVRTCLQILTHAGGPDLEASLAVLASGRRPASNCGLSCFRYQKCMGTLDGSHGNR